jgi:hypothetical protein
MHTYVPLLEKTDGQVRDIFQPAYLLRIIPQQLVVAGIHRIVPGLEPVKFQRPAVAVWQRPPEYCIFERRKIIRPGVFYVHTASKESHA